MIKKFKSMSVLVIGAIFLLNNAVCVAASDTRIVLPETQNVIDETVRKCGVDESYFTNIVDNFLENGYSDKELLNEGLIEAAEAIQKVYNENEINLQKEIDEYNQTVQLNSRLRSVDLNSYNYALGMFSAGIMIVRQQQCPHTAESMEHAIVPYNQVGTGWTPTALRYDNESWGTFLTRTQGFFQNIEGRFQREILMSGKDIASVTGDYVFTTDNSSKDAHMQLHKTYYSVTFVRNSDNTYKASFLISDIYDFDWTNYENIAVGFGNNYCYTVQSMGIIAPYPIYITGRM